MCCFLNLLSDDTGQDLIEYALLTAVIGLAGAAWWASVTTEIGAPPGGGTTACKTCGCRRTHKCRPGGHGSQ